MPALVIVEGISGMNFYHLADPAGNGTRSLCGVATMPTSLPRGTWGLVGHLGERYCSRCEVEAVRRQPAAPAGGYVPLYPSPCCGRESTLQGQGRTARCSQCGKEWKP